MLAWVVINRLHLPRPARGTRLARTLCSIRVLPLPALLFNVPTCKPLNVLTSPMLPRSHSHFGSHPSLISEKTSPFFSYTCVEPILQPFCFQIHACNGGCTPSPSRQPSNLLTLQPVFFFTLLRTLLQFFALAQNSTLFFSSDSALFAKNTRGGGRGPSVRNSKKARDWGPRRTKRDLSAGNPNSKCRAGVDRHIRVAQPILAALFPFNFQMLVIRRPASGAMAVVGSGSDAHAAKFILVILFVHDVPLLAAFQDFFFLRSDFLAHFQFNLLFVFKCCGQNLHHLLANGVAVVDEFHFFAFDTHFRDLVREPYDFFAGEAHCF